MNDVIKPLPPKDGEEPLPAPPLSWSGDRRVTILGVLLAMFIVGGFVVAVDHQTKRENLKEQLAQVTSDFHKEIAESRTIENKYEALKAEFDTIEEAKKSDEAELLARLRERGNMSLTCKLEVIAWQARIEGAAGVPEGTFKQMHEAVQAGRPPRASNADLIALLHATDKWEPPACAGVSL